MWLISFLINLNSNKLMSRIVLKFIALICCLLYATKAVAIQSIVNIPSAEILPKRTVQLTLADRFGPFNNNRYNILFPLVYFGLGHHSEISFGVPVIHKNTGDLIDVPISLAIKSGYDLPANFKITGVFRYQNMLEEDEPFPLSVSFVQLSKTIPKHDLRLTSGIYLFDKESKLLNTVGGVVGVEKKVLNKRVILVGDWLSRGEAFSFLGLGAKYVTKKKCVFSAIVLIPNNKENSFSFQFGFAKVLNY